MTHKPIKAAAWILALSLVFAASLAQARDRAPRALRPANESWSDGPTLYLKHKIRTTRAKNPAVPYFHAKAKLRAMKWGQKAGITINEDAFNFLNGANGKAGAVAELRSQKGQHSAASVSRKFGKLTKAAMTSRTRVGTILSKNGFVGAQQNMLAEMMVWRGLAYNSSTLAHGSFGPKDAGNAELQQKAERGLNNAIVASFKLGARLQTAVAKKDKTFLRWQDIIKLQSTAIKDFPEKEPGQVRKVNFTWPVNSFGVTWENLHGQKGQVARFQKFLEPAKNNRSTGFAKNPLRFMSTTLYWLHNVHAFRDGNGRTEVLANWSMAKAAGFPLPLDYDQGSGKFKLTATKWGGTMRNMHTFVAQGALGTERFVRKLMPHLAGHKIVSNHTDHGAVGMVTAQSKGAGQRNLMIMLPVTHARKMDAELKSEQGKNRVVHTGSSFDPSKVTIQIAVNGRHNEWKTVKPAAVNQWNRRYPWWTTVEPMYKVPLPQGANFVNFRVMGPDGKQISTADYYMDLQKYQNINSRIGS